MSLVERLFGGQPQITPEVIQETLARIENPPESVIDRVAEDLDALMEPIAPVIDVVPEVNPIELFTDKLEEYKKAGEVNEVIGALHLVDADIPQRLDAAIETLDHEIVLLREDELFKNPSKIPVVLHQREVYVQTLEYFISGEGQSPEYLLPAAGDVAAGGK